MVQLLPSPQSHRVPRPWTHTVVAATGSEIDKQILGAELSLTEMEPIGVTVEVTK